MATGIFAPLRIYDFETDFPELSAHTFYCKDYVHSEFIVLPSSSAKLLPFAVLFPNANPALDLDVTVMKAYFVCLEDIENMIQVNLDPNNFAKVIEGNDTYVFYNAATVFTAADDIPPANYFLYIEKLKLGIDYKFYSEAFVSKRFIPKFVAP
jgi:hypothetical protein